MSTTQTSHSNTSLPSPTRPIILRTLRPSDAASFVALLTDPRNGENASPTMDTAWGEAAIGRMQDGLKTQPTIVDTATGAVLSGPSRVNMVVVERSNSGEEKVIGLGGYGAIEDWEREAKKIRAGDVGVLLDTAYRGKGYALEAMLLAMDWAVAPASTGGLQLDLLTITTLVDNTAMVGLAEDKLGLKGLGVQRPAGFNKEKQELYFEVPAGEWREKRSREAVSS